VTGHDLPLYSDPAMAGVMLAVEDSVREVPMPDLDNEIAAYEKMRDDLEAHSMGKWVLVRDGQLVGTFATFDDAATVAVGKFGRGPFLIRQVGAPPVVLPASVAYRLIYGSDKVRI
jgi:hypothetical protein